MPNPIVFHSTRKILRPHSILPHLHRPKFIVESQLYFLPFQCTTHPLHNHIMDGHFRYPLWNTHKRYLLSNQHIFPYTYMMFKNNNIIELEHSSFKNYHIFSSNKWYKNSVLLPTDKPTNSCFLLFPIDSNMVDMLIQMNIAFFNMK